MKAPIFVVTRDGDILAFQSSSEATSYCESPDVEEGEYPQVYDAEGLRLRLVVASPSRQGKALGVAWVDPTRVELEPAEQQPTGLDALIEALSVGLKSRGQETAGAEREKLIAVAAKTFSRPKARRSR